MDKLVIRTEGLGRDFGRKQAVEDLTLAVEQGKVIALLGPNGAGKTTLLNLVSGRLAPSNGKAWVFAQDSRRLTPDSTSRIAQMTDRSEPHHWATLKDLMNLQKGATPGFDRGFAEHICTKRDLPLKGTYGTLSKGQKRWVLASLALASDAGLLLLDEPADGLDPSARRELYNHVRDYVTRKNATAVVATHIIGDIERIADEVAIINGGHLALHASLEDLREQVKEIELPADTDLEVVPVSVEIGWLG